MAAKCGCFQRVFQSRLSLASVRKYCNDRFVFRNICSSRYDFSQSLHGSVFKSEFVLTRRFSAVPATVLLPLEPGNVMTRAFSLNRWGRSTVFHLLSQNCAQYSTKPNRSRVRNLMIATYVSAAIGIVLLTAVGFRFYSRFKKRARGIEQVDAPQFGRRNRELYRYRGYVLPSAFIDTVVNDVPWFEVRPDDVWVVSFPKAGTTWVQEIVYLLSTDFDYEKAKALKLDQRFPFLEYPLPGHKEIARMDSPRFIKTHVPFSLLPRQIEEKKPKVIYIARNPKDTAVSLQAFHNLVNMSSFRGTLEDFAQLFLEGIVVYGPWAKHVQEGWAQRNNDNILFITYEDLHKDFRGTVEDIARFLGKSVTESQLRELQQHCSFQNMRSNDSVNYSWMKGFWAEGHFLRKGEVGDWKQHLSAETSTKFDAMAASLEPLGLQFVDD